MRALCNHSTCQDVSFLDRITVLVFDCDGVLFDSKEANRQFYNHILQHGGHPPVRPGQQEYIHMHPVRESLRYLLGEGEHYQAAMDYAQQIDFRIFNEYLHCEPGLVDMLELAKSRFQIAMATNRTASTREILTHFDLIKYFDLVVSAADVRFPKPHPESMQRILARFSVTPEQVLYIGDSAVDEALATATGVYFAAYKNLALEAHLHLARFQELRALLMPSENGNPSPNMPALDRDPG